MRTSNHIVALLEERRDDTHGRMIRTRESFWQAVSRYAFEYRSVYALDDVRAMAEQLLACEGRDHALSDVLDNVAQGADEMEAIARAFADVPLRAATAFSDAYVAELRDLAELVEVESDKDDE